MKLIEQEYHIRQEVSQEFSEQLTEIEDKHMWVTSVHQTVFRVRKSQKNIVFEFSLPTLLNPHLFLLCTGGKLELGVGNINSRTFHPLYE